MKKPKRPQVLPGARIIPRLHMQEGDRTSPFLDNDGEELQLEHPIPPSAPNHRGSVRKQVIPEDIAETLSEIALRAYTAARPTRHGKDADEPFAVSIAPVRALAAAENFVSERAYQMPLVEFRRHLSAKNKGSLRHAVEALNAHLTSSECPTELPPFLQMRELYLRDIPEGLLTEQRAISQELRKERLWRSRIGPEAMRATLQMWLDWMDELQKWAGRSKELAAAQVNFVECLAVYWADELQAPMPNTKGKGRSSDGLSAPHRQKGPFADFVREAAKLIPPEYLRGVRWDYAISECLRHRA